MSTKEMILKEVEAMSENDLARALQLLQTFGLTSHNSVKTYSEQPVEFSPKKTKLAYSKLARGRFKHLPNSSEDFAKRKQEDLLLEEISSESSA
jgi:hypothetical protein